VIYSLFCWLRRLQRRTVRAS